MLQLLAKEPANEQIDWRHISQHFNDCGAIYGIYHFTSGRWYVGQTINEVYRRAQGHWWARFRDLDLFHEALSLEEDPFSFIALPLEYIPVEWYHRPHQTRDLTRKRFRQAATPRERHWIGKLNSMWPVGWNSAVPGKLVSSARQRPTENLPSVDEDMTEPALHSEVWLSHWRLGSKA